MRSSPHRAWEVFEMSAGKEINIVAHELHWIENCFEVDISQKIVIVSGLFLYADFKFDVCFSPSHQYFENFHFFLILLINLYFQGKNWNIGLSVFIHKTMIKYYIAKNTHDINMTKRKNQHTFAFVRYFFLQKAIFLPMNIFYAWYSATSYWRV